MLKNAESVEDARIEVAEGGSAPLVVVVGGGISGLAAAHRLIEIAPGTSVRVLEAGERPGGVLRTVRRDGFLIDESADSFLTAAPGALDLCRRLGIEDQLIPTDPNHRRAFVASRGKLAPIPDGLMIMSPSRLLPLATTPILGPLGKLRMVMEPFVGRGPEGDESLEAFAVRRFGRQAFERLIQPLLGGMYTGDPAKLSLLATMPRFREVERTRGSLIRAALADRRKRRSAGVGSGARYGLFVGLREGMASLVDALTDKLPPGAVRCGAKVKKLSRTPDGRWRLELAGPRGESIEADGVAVATPARAAGRLVAGVDGELAARLERIGSTSCAVVSLAYRREQVAHRLDGFGFVVPRVERMRVLSGSFSSIKFSGRAAEGCVLFRAFLGGVFQPELLGLADEELAATASGELSKLLGIQGEPVFSHLSRWVDVMPQYEVGHLDLVAEIEDRVARVPGLELAGNAYRGVGVPQCVHAGERAAERLAAQICA